VNPSGTATLDPRARVLGHTLFHIPGGSMAPTLVPGDYILVATYVYRSNPPQRGDVIVFRYPPNPKQSYVKRVIGVPGDVVKMESHRLWLNGEELEESYTQHETQLLGSRGEWSVPAGHLFVLGDNRDNSSDSRMWGFVAHDQVVGRLKSVF